MAKTHPAFKNIIPAPVEMTSTGEFFEIRATTPIYTEAETRPLGQELAATLYQWTGLQLAVKENPAEPQAEGIFVQRTDSQPTGREAYTLEITATTLKLAASQPAGVFYGIQTILQLVLQQNIPADRIQIPTGTIQDSPRFGYRGVMLDVSRHFFGVEDVKHYIDLLAFYKINILHLHLSDDQGWRIEIKSWPNLTAHGSKTQVGGGEGGYFTQATAVYDHRPRN